MVKRVLSEKVDKHRLAGGFVFSDFIVGMGLLSEDALLQVQTIFRNYEVNLFKTLFNCQYTLSFPVNELTWRDGKTRAIKDANNNVIGYRKHYFASPIMRYLENIKQFLMELRARMISNLSQHLLLNSEFIEGLATSISSMEMVESPAYPNTLMFNSNQIVESKFPGIDPFNYALTEYEKFYLDPKYKLPFIHKKGDSANISITRVDEIIVAYMLYAIDIAKRTQRIWEVHKQVTIIVDAARNELESYANVSLQKLTVLLKHIEDINQRLDAQINLSQRYQQEFENILKSIDQSISLLFLKLHGSDDTDGLTDLLSRDYQTMVDVFNGFKSLMNDIALANQVITEYRPRHARMLNFIKSLSEDDISEWSPEEFLDFIQNNSDPELLDDLNSLKLPIFDKHSDISEKLDIFLSEKYGAVLKALEDFREISSRDEMKKSIFKELFHKMSKKNGNPHNSSNGGDLK